MVLNASSTTFSCFQNFNITTSDLENLELDEFVGEFSEYVPEEELALISEGEDITVALHLVPLALIGFLLTLVYIVAVFRAIKAGIVSEKFYALLLNRALGDLMYTFLYILDHLMEMWRFSADLTSPLNIVIEGVFWASMVSYVSLSLMKLYAIACPLMYWKKVTMARVVLFIVLSWLGFIVFVVFRIYLRAKCTEHKCLIFVHRIVGAVHLFCYAFTVICFLLTVLYAWHTQTSTNTAGKTQENIKHGFQIPMFKLSLNVATLTICHLPLAIIGVLLAFGSNHFWFEIFPCFVVSNFKFVRSVATFVQCVFILRIVLDSLIGFATDKHIRKLLTKSVSPTENNDLSGKSSMPPRSTDRTS